MGETIMESLKESVQDVKEFFFMFFVIGGLVWIPALFFFGMLALRAFVSEIVFVILLLPMMGLFMFVMSFWLNYFGADDPAPPLVP